MALANTNVGKRFNFKENGHGTVTHETRASFRTWSAVIQILEFEDEEHRGNIRLRFGYCDDTGTLIARPLYINEERLAELGRAAAREPEIKRMLRAFCDQIR